MSFCIYAQLSHFYTTTTMTSFLNSITKRKKTPEQLVSSACTSLSGIYNKEHTGAVDSGAEDTLCKRLGQMKTILYGDGKSNEVDEDKAFELAQRIIAVCHFLLAFLCLTVLFFDFELVLLLICAFILLLHCHCGPCLFCE